MNKIFTFRAPPPYEFGWRYFAQPLSISGRRCIRQLR